jgi:hypothetical protein
LAAILVGSRDHRTQFSSGGPPNDHSIYIYMFVCTLKMTRKRKNGTTSINICSKLIWVLCLSIQTQNISISQSWPGQHYRQQTLPTHSDYGSSLLQYVKLLLAM